jgi:transcriptional regulator
MYIPGYFANHNSEEINDFIRANSFGVLISTGEKILATHIPLELSQDAKFLSGHLSRANPQSRELHDGGEVLCIFQGPHAYISSSWYNHENVPTWNYISAHVRGNIKIIQGQDLYNRLSEIVDKYESASEKPVSVAAMSRDFLDRHIRAIVGFDIEISSIEAAYKLSQNRDTANYLNILNELAKRGDHNSLAIAEEMKKRTPKV